MITKVQLVLIRCLLTSLFLILLLTGAALAQSPAPLAVLNIALWPEYDRPDVLVIYRGQVAQDVPLPAQVSFTLPATVEALNAVAYLDEAQGRLLNIPEYEFVEGPDGRVLSFATPSRQFQFEYYSNDILSREGDTRELSFSFTPNAEVADLSFELQQPTAAREFTSDPLPSDTQTRQDGLIYAFYALGAVPTGDPRSLQVSYTRDTDQLSAETLVSVNLPPAEQTAVEVGGGGLQDYLGPILIGVGILLLTGSLIYWFWSQRSVVVPEPTPRQSSAPARRPSGRRKPDVSQSGPPASKDEKLTVYCHRCGTRFREDALFCHACGSERRAE